jgi:hypothetical protein
MDLRPFRFFIILNLFLLITLDISVGQVFATSLFSNQLDNRTLTPDQPVGATMVYLPIAYKASTNMPSPLVNAPYFNDQIVFTETAVFWLGRVTSSENYVDVRVGYNDQELWIHTAVFDRRLWYDETPSPADLTDWDSISLLIHLNGNVGNSPDRNTYRFDSQLNWGGSNLDYQAAYRGTGSGWNLDTISFIAEAGWASVNTPNDNNDDRGWLTTYHIPFTALGLSGPPSPGTTWGLGVILHDRDSQNGPPQADQTWPEIMDINQPGTWGRLSFGLPSYTPLPSSFGGTVTIRHKLNGAVVKDGHVGGSIDCGQAFNPNFFNGWGDANYAGAQQVNIQNQANLGDWPCFSKFYVTFPLEAIPSGKIIRAATLTLYQFGNSDPSSAYGSVIQVLTVAEDWDETTLTWNNAPYAWENVSQTWVNPLPGFPGLPGVPNNWDLTRAVAEAYQKGIPLRLVLYDSDYYMHSGKYFYSSDVDDGMPTSRPRLVVDWGNP